MKKRRAIVRLSIIFAVVVVGIIFASVPMKFGLKDYKSFAGAIQLGIDLKGGVFAVYEVAEGEDTTDIVARLEGTKERIKALLADKGGWTEATVVREGENRLRVEVPNVDDPTTILAIIGEPADMQFMLEGSEVLNGSHVVNASAVSDPQNVSQYAVRLELNSDGAQRFFEATGEANTGKSMSIYINGTMITQATINEPIPDGVALITGTFTLEQAETLAGQILSGAMDVKLTLVESNTVSPTLGQEALKLGLIAGGIGLLLVILFMCFVYRGLGMASSLALLAFTVLLLFFLSVLPWVQLTLPGIAGVILSLGMAVDANVVIFERIKEEYKSGKSISSSVHAGFKRALAPILDANVTTLIASIVLWILGSGPVQGFAITLFVGIVLSMFTALIVARVLIMSMLQINKTNDRFYGLRRPAGVEEIPDEEQPKQERKLPSEAEVANA